MAQGENTFAPPGVDVADLVLQHGHRVRAAGSRRGLVAGQRRAVLAEAGPQISDRLVQRGCVGVAQGERLLIMGEGVAVCVQAPRLVAGEPRIFRGLRVLSGQTVVAGYLAEEGTGLAPPEASRQRGGDAAVQETPAGQARLLVDQGPQLVVVEVVGRSLPAGASYLPDQAPRGQLFQGRKGLLFAPTAGRADRVEVERPSDDGGGREHLSGRLAYRPEAPAQ